MSVAPRLEARQRRPPHLLQQVPRQQGHQAAWRQALPPECLEGLWRLSLRPRVAAARLQAAWRVLQPLWPQRGQARCPLAGWLQGPWRPRERGPLRGRRPGEGALGPQAFLWQEPRRCPHRRPRCRTFGSCRTPGTSWGSGTVSSERRRYRCEKTHGPTGLFRDLAPPAGAAVSLPKTA
ncbi:unnamed protein product [Prorocentrum cordatum]|uniref:Uncharacterized protein n=1 Tax=Prorocentrum cordatum TaxID=2364126 RepID=A0ABN9S4J5_9DINO|nr:unnamed protein product [Polarella glacialis]